jgi:hypothetical protein
VLAEGPRADTELVPLDLAYSGRTLWLRRRTSSGGCTVPKSFPRRFDGPTPHSAGDRVVIRETIRDAGLHNDSVATVKRVQGFVRRVLGPVLVQTGNKSTHLA